MAKKTRKFYFSSVTMNAVGHLLAWEKVAPHGMRRWSLEGDKHGFEIILVHHGEIEIRNVDTEVDILPTIEEMINDLGGTFQEGGMGEYD